MKKKIVWILLSSLIIISMLPVAGCNGDEATTPPANGTSSTPAASTPVASSDWWDEFGEPQYGGTINLPTFRVGSIEENIDTWYWNNLAFGYHDTLLGYNWTLDRDVFPFQGGWVPADYMGPGVAEEWEWTDAQTLVMNIREDVYWQDKEPVNGRKFTAHDVVYHFDRMLGTGEFAEPNPLYAGWAGVFEYVEATGDFTIVIHFNYPTMYNNMLTMYDPIVQHMEAREFVEAGDTDKWENAVGTGPFFLTDMVSGSKMTLARNPEYWCYDERHPENQLPYADEVNYICIADISTEVAALKTGKIDMMIEMSSTQAERLAETNPEIVQMAVDSWSNQYWFRIDSGPFSDIRVRKAMELSFDRATASEALYGTGEQTMGLVPAVYTGFATDYADWPAGLKAEYGYDLEQARALLSEAGYPDGFATDIVVNNTEDMELMQVMKAYFSEAGVEMEITVMDAPTANNYISARKHTGMSSSQGGLGAPPSIGLQNAGGARNNNLCYEDATYEEYLDQYLNAGSNDEAKAASNAASQYVVEQHWMIGQVPKVVYNVWQPYLKGYSGECGGSYYSMQGWYWARYWIDKSLKK